MVPEWKIGRLADITDIIMGQSPKGETCNANGQGIPLLNGPTEFGGHHPIPLQYTADPRKIAKTGDILFCVRGSTTGRMNWADKVYAIGRGIAAIRHKKGREYQPFIRAVLDHKLPELLATATGSTFPNVSRKQLQDLDILIPPADEQRSIACILGTLDDKIELNRQINKTLESIAKAVFKSWFIDFDPVHAKMEGREPYGMDAETTALFPDSFEDSSLGKIPEGWRVAPINTCCQRIQNGGTPKRGENTYWEPATIPWLTSGEVRQSIIVKTENFMSELGLEKSSAKWLPSDSTVVALYGATAGQVSFVSTDLTTNQAVCALIPKKYYRYFNYLTLKNIVHELSHQARGSAQQNISKQIVESVKVIIPTEDILRCFDSFAALYFNKWIANLKSNDTLATLLDTLLPKLLSGEIRVKDAEKFVEAVT